MKALRTSAALASFALAFPALAQSDATDSLGSVASENSFGRDRNIGVLERPHPDYTPEPIKVGLLDVMPRIAIGAGYDDNLYGQQNDRIGDGYVRIRPRISITRPSPNLRLSVNGEFDLLRQVEQASENATNYSLGASALYTISGNTNLGLTASRDRATQERVSPDSPTNVTRPTRFTVTGGSATLTHTFNRLRLRSVLEAEKRNYRDGVTPAGDVVDQDFRDQTTLTATGIGEYALSPSISLFLAGSYNNRDYRRREGPVPARDSSGFELAAGSSFEIGRLMRGALRLGYLKQNYREPIFRDVSGLLVRGEIAYFVTPLLTLTGTLDRSVSETGVLEASGYLKTVATLRADYELLRNLILGASTEMEKRDFQNLDRKDDRWNWRANATYRLNKQITLRGDVQHRNQSSDGVLPGREFKDNRISIGLTFSGL